ncbi:unnamed protein product [Bursaphelenchus xylophilus]|uniref:(pine wood nematode) hypothetical protein n=1 Tax=Bursaphelenchus xylophilus TaxID=6326 RepID=A0A1I7SRE1_BURXY|nr:unnamed protein product [Bursaphelenchus xylophilus]CAG9102549.1 unnamed protein product [Bursaphelenchus xylophilus]
MSQSLNSCASYPQPDDSAIVARINSSTHGPRRRKKARPVHICVSPNIGMKSPLSLLVLMITKASCDICHRCAQGIFKDNWLATGFPVQPPNMTYTDACANSLGEAFEVQCGGSTCYAAAFVIQGTYGVIRGCPEDFIAGSNVPASATGKMCEYARYTGTASVAPNGRLITNPFVGINVCTGTAKCNSERALANSASFAETEWGATDTNCKLKSGGVQCLECTHFDGEGSCEHDSKQTCTGPYCVKAIGKLNGRRFEHRGCTAINPLQVDYCYNFNRPINSSLLGMSINQEFSGTQCICGNQRCNSSLVTESSIFLSVMGLIFGVTVNF